MKKIRVFLDLDCVLADFVSGALRAHGLTWADAEPHWPAGDYGMTRPLARAKGLASAPEEWFWAPINDDPRFWYGLDPLPWAAELVDLVRGVDPDFHVVTSPSRCTFCVPGKQWWLNRLFGVEWFGRMVATPHKELFAHVPGAVLIDDCDANLEKFAAAGGGIISFPVHHNRDWRLRFDPMTSVRERLESLRRSE